MIEKLALFLASFSAVGVVVLLVRVRDLAASIRITDEELDHVAREAGVDQDFRDSRGPDLGRSAIPSGLARPRGGGPR